MKYSKKFKEESKYLAYITSSGASLPNVSYISESKKIKYNSFKAIVLNSLTWSKDVASSGGTADANNCSYVVKGVRVDGTQYDVSSFVNVAGSITVSASTVTTRREIGTLNLTFSIGHLSVSGSVTAYQEGTTVESPAVYFNMGAGSQVTLPSAGSFEYSTDKINWSAQVISYL